MKVLQNLVFVVVSVGFSEFICCAVSISLCIQSVFKGCFRLQCLKSEINGTDLSKKKTKAKNSENFFERSRFDPSRRLYGNRANMT